MTKEELISALMKIDGNPEIVIVDYKYNTMVAIETGETAGIYEEFEVVYFDKQEMDSEMIALMFRNPEMGIDEFDITLN